MAIWDFTMSKYMIASRAYHYTNTSPLSVNGIGIGKGVDIQPSQLIQRWWLNTFKVRQFQVFGRLGMKTLNVRLVIVTRLDKMAPIDYLINKKCVYQHTCAGIFG